MATFTVPNFHNNALATQGAGIMHMRTQFKSSGVSLDPVQRTGAVMHRGFPVSPPRGSRSIGGNSYAAMPNVANPPIVAYAGPVSHTRMLNFHV
jgi:hypothetical protein